MSDAPASRSRTSRAAILTAAGLAGGGVMTVELAAVRLLAPHFGSSTSVWTNVIGVVLVALAVGYVLGARWSRGPAAVGRLNQVLFCAAAWLVVLPFVAPHLGAALRPEAIALQSALPLFTWGSLAASLVLFAPPIVVLGTVGPLSTELVQRSGVEHAGTAGGWVLGASTIGSLAGTFATTHLLVPELGLRPTFFVAAALLLFAAGTLAFAGRAAGLGGGAALLVVGFLVGDRAPSVAEGDRLVAWGESTSTQVRVIERDDPERERLRYLQVGESSDSFQSVWQPATGLLPLGFYYNDFVLPLWWDARLRDGSARVLYAGLGAGSAWRVMLGAKPDGTQLSGVGLEIDPLVVEFARTHLDLEHEALEVHAGADARAALRCIEGAFDVIVVDAYANQFEIPEHLATVEYFRELRERLAPGGWLVSNAAGFGFDDPVVRALGETLATAFSLEGREAEVLALSVPFSRNITLFARRDTNVVLPGDPKFVPAGDEEVASLAESRVRSGAWTTYSATDAPLADARGHMLTLQRRSLALAEDALEVAAP